MEHITCAHEELLKELRAYLRQDEHANKVGEFACGTNTSLKEVMGNLLQDEKFPGIHMAFGYPYPENTGADWTSDGHLDGIMKRCSVWFDSVQVMEDGKYTLGGI